MLVLLGLFFGKSKPALWKAPLWEFFVCSQLFFREKAKKKW